jgi:hypothetical protein
MARNTRYLFVWRLLFLATTKFSLVLPSQILEASNRNQFQDSPVLSQNPLQFILAGASNCMQTMGCSMLSTKNRFAFYDTKSIGPGKADQCMTSRSAGQEFQASERCDGPRKGFVFKMGENGLGYYGDTDAHDSGQHGTSDDWPLSTRSNFHHESISCWPPTTSYQGMLSMEAAHAGHHRHMTSDLQSLTMEEATDGSRSLWAQGQPSLGMESADFSGTDSWVSSDSCTITGISKRRDGKDGRLCRTKKKSEKKNGPRLCKFDGGCTKLASFGDEGTRSPSFCKQVCVCRWLCHACSDTCLCFLPRPPDSSRAQYKRPWQLNIVSRRCFSDACVKRPVFGDPGTGVRDARLVPGLPSAFNWH